MLYFFGCILIGIGIGLNAYFIPYAISFGWHRGKHDALKNI